MKTKYAWMAYIVAIVNAAFLVIWLLLIIIALIWSHEFIMPPQHFSNCIYGIAALWFFGDKIRAWELQQEQNKLKSQIENIGKCEE